MEPWTQTNNRKMESVLTICTLFICFAQVALIGLKLFGIIDWPWLHVAFPIMATFVAMIITAIVFAWVGVILAIAFGSEE